MTFALQWPTLGLSLLLAGCATTAPPATVTPQPPVQWQAPLPHNGT